MRKYTTSRQFYAGTVSFVGAMILHGLIFCSAQQITGVSQIKEKITLAKLPESEVRRLNLDKDEPEMMASQPKVSSSKISTTDSKPMVDSKTVKYQDGPSKTRPADLTHTTIAIEVVPPMRDWNANDRVLIHWSGGRPYDVVQIDLVSKLSYGATGQPLDSRPVVASTPNNGSYNFTVPEKWVNSPFGWALRVQTLDGQVKGNAPMKLVCTQPVDLQCRVVDAYLKWQASSYVFKTSAETWLEFNVLIRNLGTISPIEISQVLVRLIKEPENIVVFQEEWGISNIYYHEWYRLPEPRRINIKKFWADFIFDSGRTVNIEEGFYRVEVELDPLNRLGENDELRQNNKDVRLWKITY